MRDIRRPRRTTVSGANCPRCWRSTKPTWFSDDDYAELLGLYLGDGCIAQLPRTQRLRLSFDARYPGIVRDARYLLNRCFPSQVSGELRVAGKATVVVWIYSSHLACLFPQHGLGKKHNRAIALEPWQETVVARSPWALLRGLIRSDGCCFVNRTGPYEYVSYDFTNLSRGIMDLFVSTCRSVGVDVRGYDRNARINRRPSVALLQEHVGIKC